MAKFEEEKVINALHPEKAEVGKRYYYSDNLLNIKKYVEENNHKGKLTSIKNCYISPFQLNNEISTWQFLYPYEESPKQRMTNIQLMEWISKRNGIFKYKNSTACCCYTYYTSIESNLNEEVETNVVIRTWDSEEWVEPTVDIYERDCKGGKE